MKLILFDDEHTVLCIISIITEMRNRYQEEIIPKTIIIVNNNTSYEKTVTESLLYVL